MKLTKEDIAKLNKTYRGKLVKLSSGKYFCKMCVGNDQFSSLTYAVNEVLAHEVLKDLKITSPRYYIALASEEDDIYSLISENLNNKAKFYTAAEMGITNEDGSSLFSIWNHLETHFTKDLHVYIDIIKLYLFDLFFLNVDRHISNWGLIFDGKKYHVAALDNEEILLIDYLVPIISPYYDTKEWQEKLYNITINTEEQEKVIKETNFHNLMVFFRESSQEYIELFEELHEMLTPTYFTNLLKRIEQKEVIYTLNGEMPLNIPQKEVLIAIYTENYNLITDVYEKYKEERRKR